MRRSFVESVLQQLLDQGLLTRTDRLLTVCSGQPEHELFRSLGFANVTISNLDPRQSPDDYRPYDVSFQNALALSFEDGQFDFAFVSDGLHHCSSPHRALLEMYRVARKGVIVIESRDSLLMRLAVALDASPEYEVGSVIINDCRYGGVDNSDIPNYIYRWTEREFMKTVQAGHPVGQHRFIFRYAFSAPVFVSGSPLVRLCKQAAIAALALLIPLVAKRQGNSFAMIALRPQVPDELWPWLQLKDGRVCFRK